ncbi:tyrosine-type recombinase/integrase [Sphingobacterium spiritivorum]|uniref:tyrosine-type recombinase/integrase n=1 Tax=Sphingobacterium spiritivorum TaxID=258 RepID=UPI003DA56969
MTKVKLRESQLKNGLTSLYLDYYPPIVNSKTGKETRREFLKLYYNKKAKDPVEKQKNQIIKMAAEKIRLDRENKLLTGAFEEGSFFAQKESFLEFFKKECKNRATSDGNYNNWLSSYKYFEKYTNGKCLFKEVTEKLSEGFKNYLEGTYTLNSDARKLSANSKHMYFNKYKAAIKEAYNQGLLAKNHTSRIQSPKAETPYREFLTIEEVGILKNAYCENDVVKRAALFSFTTGFRIGDILQIKWESYFFDSENGHYLRFKSQKTSEYIIHPISEQAFELMGKVEDKDERIFKGLKYSAHNNIIIDRWVRMAGINKRISWHNFRHSYAVAVIEKYGIYAGKEMLHHKQVKTTEIYAKIRLKHKSEIANSIKI